MSKIEEAREFINELTDVEELILDNTQGLNLGEASIGEARKQLSGLERNCLITKLDGSLLRENPYIKNLHIENWLYGNIYLTNKTKVSEYKTYCYEMRKRDPKNLTTIYHYCYFKENLNIPTLGKLEGLDLSPSKWMGVEPSEISSFAPFIAEAHGNILLMGCGLGYVAYMLSLKDNVDKITIVELDKNVLGMFETYLKPQMNRKISIVNADALEFLEVENLSKYDYCSIDIWHGVAEMYQIYLKCLLLEQKHKSTKFHYWVEEDLHNVLEMIWLRFLRKIINDDKIKEDFSLFTDTLKSIDIGNIDEIKEFIRTPKRKIITDWALKNPDTAKKQKSLNYIWTKTN